MTKRYVIRWKSKVNGRIGQGSRQFDREEAEALVSELNEEYPDIQHEVAEAPDSPPGDSEPVKENQVPAFSE